MSAAYEGWEEDPDGSRHFLFGYMNSNWEETPDVSVGPDNYFVLGEPGTGGADPTAFDSEVADQGQPTHFLPRRNRFVFRVPVPEGFEETDEVIWTLTVNDKTVSAYASLRLDYRVDNIIKASEQGAIGAGTTNPVIRANTSPELSVEGETTRTVRVGEPLMLVAFASDDGVPKATEPGRNNDPFRRAAPDVPAGWLKPRQITVGSATGLRQSWYTYRGRRDGGVRPRADQGVGRHQGPREFTLGQLLVSAAGAAGRQVRDHGDVRPARHLRAALSRVRRKRFS